MPFPESELARERFEEVAAIGQGAFGRVYRAMDRRLRRPVAVKEVAAAAALDAPARAAAYRRFEREAQLVARLSSPQIVAVYGYDDDRRQGERYLYLEHVAGGTLAAALAGGGRLPEHAAAAVGRDVALAVAAHWAQGVVHRDIKPANVLLVRDGAGAVVGAKLADYGIAQDLGASQHSALAPGQGHPGTAGYLSPEQASSAHPLTAASDLYNVGLLLWEMLAGAPRYREPHAPATAARLGCGAALAALVGRALAPDPARRPQDPAALARDLAALAAAAAPTAEAPPTAELPPRPAGGRRRAGVALAGAALVVALLALGLAGARARAGAPGAPAPPPAAAIPTPDAAGVATANAQALAALRPTDPPAAPATASSAAAAPAATPPPTATTTLPPAAAAGPTQTRAAELVAVATALAPPTPPPTATPTPTATPLPPAAAPPAPTPTAVPPTPTPAPTPTMTPLPPSAPPTAALQVNNPASLLSGSLLYASDKEADQSVPSAEHKWAIYQFGLGGTTERRLTSLASSNYNPVVSADGRSIAFVSERDGNGEIYVMNIDGSGQQRLTQNAAQDDAPAWSPDGRQLVFRSYRESTTGAIYVMNRDGSNIRRLVNAPAAWPTWSVKGTIVFTRAINSAQSLFTTTLNAPGVTQITSGGEGDDDAPSFSPDGSKLAFSTGPTKEDRRIVVANADGSGRRDLTASGADNSDPVWSPDGGWIAFASDRTGVLQLHIMRADGSDDRIITSGPGKKWYISWAP